MRLARFNAAGLERMSAFLASLTTETPEEYPANVLTDRDLTGHLPQDVDLPSIHFDSRMEAARFLHEFFMSHEVSGIERDIGLWSWLALYYFDQLCPADENGKRRPGEQARWILNASGRRYYRHLLAGPYFVYRAHRDNPARAMALLCGPLHAPNTAYWQLSENQQLLRNPAIVEAATILYYNTKNGKLRRGAGRHGLGGVKRFAAVLSQFDVTWDLHSMSAQDIIEMLPGEFDGFKRNTQAGMLLYIVNLRYRFIVSRTVIRKHTYRSHRCCALQFLVIGQKLSASIVIGCS